MDVMLKIGTLTLGVNEGPGYESLSRRVGVEWASQARIGRKDALQFTGIGSHTITLTGVVFGLFNEQGIGQIKKLEEIMDKHEPQLVIDGTGRSYGYFVIDEILEEQSNFITNGAPQKQTYTLAMREYGEDMIQAEAIQGDGSMDLNRIPGGVA